ncbi:hypothetical protein SAMN05421493_11044 [Pseudobutyrivibrio sp. 49]|uniref:hypothetical protein n=1 Tax=unclassified Pseudobutyrivibrio TaxID=2638619 RepID=UPI00088AAC01|nr:MULTISPECIES: hypothetical protein [unclassified Pseudobutyrivibrio]SDI23579.1 hypothetical protein SAMN05421493_11044 [Pseudobutyrivibrio sp. 49]SFO14177.1 hypothetical protein SAMN04487831_10984 [Pseudobutyrivibrio sp. UC1225]
MIYALHYSVHGDVTTYYTVTFNEIMDSEDELTDSDIYPFNTYLECSIGNRLYEGAESIEDIKNSQCEIVGTTNFVVDESSSL